VGAALSVAGHVSLSRMQDSRRWVGRCGLELSACAFVFEWPPEKLQVGFDENDSHLLGAV